MLATTHKSTALRISAHAKTPWTRLRTGLTLRLEPVILPPPYPPFPPSRNAGLPHKISLSPMNAPSRLRYSRDDRPPHLLAALLGAQTVVLILASITLTPLIVLQTAGDDAQAFASWLIFAALLVSGIFTIIQARPIGPVGSGYLLFMGSSSAYIAIAVTAIQAGGLPLLGTLIICSALIQFLFAARLSLLRRLVTPTLGGIVIMLISVSVFPIVFGMLTRAPATMHHGEQAALITALATFIVIAGMALFGRGPVRLWAPLFGVIVGMIVAWTFGMVDFSAMRAAPLLGLPDARWPGLDLSFSPVFWILLPGFLIVTVVGALETYGDGVAVQRISHHQQRPTDYKAVQGALYADGVGNMVAGLANTMPNTTYSIGISLTELTGVTARRVGIYGGLILIMLAFSPKISVLLQSIPGPVAGVYLMILLVLLFAHGLRLVTADGLSQDNALVIGLAFWLGMGFQYQLLFRDLIPEWALTFADNGMTAGTVVAILLTVLLALKRRVPNKIVLDPVASSVPSLHDFLRRLGRTQDWSSRTVGRLELVAEEAFMFLLENAGPSSGKMRRVYCWARQDSNMLELELLITESGRSNLEQVITELREQPNEPGRDTIGPTLLKQLTTELRHLQFHDADCLMVKLTLDPAPVR